MIKAAEREAMVRELLDRTSLPRPFAEEVVAISLGEIEGDAGPVRPLTPEERQRIGMGATLEEALERMERNASSLAHEKARA